MVSFGPRFAVDGRQEGARSCQSAGGTSLRCPRRGTAVSAVPDYCQLTGTLPPLLDSVVGGGTPGRSFVSRLWPGQSRPSDSKLCPKWKLEKQIQENNTNKNISYFEARKLIVPQLTQTYAQATKPSTISTTTQTDSTIQL
ncbi:uncharacterized protein TNCV_1399231 [Trichonephila clavipes]|nr:uncharacterized protein TNCV_1399231 [Trichonephila clavipes]